MRLLVVDWDYFFPTRGSARRFPKEWHLWDWQHSETLPIYYEAIWPIRASVFFGEGRELPGLDEDALAGFWSRFRFSPRAQCFTADSNMYAAHQRVGRNVSEVWLFDAHHDCGYAGDADERAALADRVITEGRVTCEDWMIAYAAMLGPERVHMRYPTHRADAFELEPETALPIDRAFDDGAPVPGTFDRVFICRSPAWVPPWLDERFVEFTEAAPVRRLINLDEHARTREWDETLARSMAGDWRRLREDAEARRVEHAEAAVVGGALGAPTRIEDWPDAEPGT